MYDKIIDKLGINIPAPDVHNLTLKEAEARLEKEMKDKPCKLSIPIYPTSDHKVKDCKANETLARELAVFMDGFDHYELMDCYGGVEEATMEIIDELKRKETRKGIAGYMRDIAIYADIFEDRIKAAKLYRKVMTL